jgi:hypothetical protein
MVRDPVIEVVFVEIGVHPHALGVQNLVILRARERREEEELDQVERHLPLDDLDIAGDLLRRVVLSPSTDAEQDEMDLIQVFKGAIPRTHGAPGFVGKPELRPALP